MPEARLDWLVDIRHAPLLRLVPAIDRVITVDSRSPGALVSVVRRLRKEGYDASVDLQGLVKSAALTRLSGARRVVGFPAAHLREKPAAVFYSERCSPPDGGHVVEKNLALLSAFGIEDRARRFPIAVPDSPVRALILERVSSDGHCGYALVNPGAGWPNKRWPADRFGEVAARLATRHALLPVVLWGPGEESLARAVVGASSERRHAGPRHRHSRHPGVGATRAA